MFPLEDAGVPRWNVDGQTVGVQLIGSSGERCRGRIENVGKGKTRRCLVGPLAGITWDVDVCVGVSIWGEIADNKQGVTTL